jgi:hypothetical protein
MRHERGLAGPARETGDEGATTVVSRVSQKSSPPSPAGVAGFVA